jgi:hypothetical protein
MRSSSEGTRESREGEPYSQNANFTEAAMVKLMSNRRDPISIDTPNCERFGNSRPSNAPDNDGQGVWEQSKGYERVLSLTPQLERDLQESGNLSALTCNEDSSKRGTPRQGLKTAPKAAQNLRHEQRRNLDQLPQG